MVQADGESPLIVLVEIHAIFKKGDHDLQFDALVVKDLANNVIGGAPFLDVNDIFIRMPRNGNQWNVHIGDKSIYISTPPSLLDFNSPASSLVNTAWPIKILRGESIFFPLPPRLKNDAEIYFEPLQGKDFFSLNLYLFQIRDFI